MLQDSFWKFIDSSGTFIAKEPQKISYLCFPLANETGIMSSITPDLKGDIKTDNNSFLMLPVTRRDLLQTNSSRNFWLYLHKNKKTWPLAGSDKNNLRDKLILKAGPLYHTIIRKNVALGLEAQITNFVPITKDLTELMFIKLTNTSKSALEITPTSAIPLFCRSADNLRDHNQVTSLLNRIRQDKYGVVVKPVMSFDERGHKINQTSYFVFGIDNNNSYPVGSFPTQESFIGEGNNLNNPLSVTANLLPKKLSVAQLSGKEAMGALRFKKVILKPKQSISFGLVLGIGASEKNIYNTFKKFNTIHKIKAALEENKTFWNNKLHQLSFQTHNFNYDNWLRWVRLQPTLRKIYGCSFLPDFDYGRGGKGWRDLWQDCLAMLLTNPQGLRPIISSNFSGVRIDGSNATIITKKPGCFIADRNKISRVWMDHGIWPFITLDLYINQTRDIGILLERKSYFSDTQVMRYKGTILEHILIQHLVQFFNVGPHNNIRLKNADWNDGLDMATDKGESVAFSAFYAYNLSRIAEILEKLKQIKNLKEVEILKEITILLDTLNKPANYNSVKGKTNLLNKYLNSTQLNVSGQIAKVKIDDLIKDLKRKSLWLSQNISKNEWINIGRGAGFFNGYYDNKSRRVEGRYNGLMRMTLTGQVFAILSGIASDAQVRKIYKAAKIYLEDKKLKGFRLNTDFKTLQPELGRAFSFSYGDKENGAIFSHMAVMFAYALYSRGFAQEGFEVLNSLYELAVTSSVSKIYPNLPEYFNLEGRGMYSYLTGSASWFILTLLTESFGVKADMGDLVISPKLVKEQFKTSNQISVQLNFARKKIKISYLNPHKKDYPHYKIKQIKTNIPCQKLQDTKILIKRESLVSYPSQELNINIILD